MKSRTHRTRRALAHDDMPRLVTDTWTLPQAVVCRVIGEIDIATAPQTATALRRALGRVRGGQELWADLSGASFFSAAGLNVLLRIHEAATAKAVSLVLVAPSTPVLRVLRLTHTLPLFTTRPSPAVLTATDATTAPPWQTSGQLAGP